MGRRIREEIEDIYKTLESMAEMQQKVLKFLKNKEEQEVKVTYVKLRCPQCFETFMIDKDHSGIITCPYCSAYVEG